MCEAACSLWVALPLSARTQGQQPQQFLDKPNKWQQTVADLYTPQDMDRQIQSPYKSVMISLTNSKQVFNF